MRFIYFVLFFIILALSADADWETYENGLGNSANSDGVGYFPLNTANFSNGDFGTDFQPLVSDLDNDGKNEIIIFSNNSLVILNPQLDVNSQTKIGSILGQPTLFNVNGTINIIFNARQDSDYFFAYKFSNSDLIQSFNISLGNAANFSGIKCVNLNGTDTCVFKDKLNYVHVADLNSRQDNSYKVSESNEKIQTVPAIGDLDNDGNKEAVFWLDDDGSGGYGLVAFDLISRSVKWKIDNIFSPFLSSYVLKGQPVLADLNNDGKLEVAVSVFYDDSDNHDNRLDLFTELLVYDYNGTKLFSKCETNPNLNAGCNSGNYPGREFDGTNPFVTDYDKNGINDICFLKTIDFSYMGLGCYNYSGSEIAEVKLIQSLDGVTETAMAADMDDDGSKEIITSSHIYLLNGTSIFDYDLGKYHPIAVDLDGNSGLDLLWSKNSQIKAFLDNNNYTMDLSVSDINFFKFNSTHINVTAIIENNGQLQADNVKVRARNTETLDNNDAIFNINRNGNAAFSSILPLKAKEQVLISADYDNEISESDENNNDVYKTFLGLPYVFVSVDLELPNIESEFKDYIKNNLVSGYYTEDENEADVLVYIGKNNPRNMVNNINIMDPHNMRYDYGNINYNDKVYSNSFNGLVAAFKEDNQFGKNHINVMIVGNEIEGDIAATKEFIKNQVMFLNTKTFDSAVVDDNEDAVKVWDYMHLGGNSEHYKDGSDEFKKIVHNALNDKMFNVYDKTVLTSNGVNLRLRNLKANFSDDFIDYLNSSGTPVEMPVVLASGLFSNLTTWETLGSELSNSGRDTWLIEITGGPGQDCDNCIDYTFYNLTDIFVPALLNGVLTFTGKDKLQYVGFSNGCRVALDSLERNQFDSNKVETFVAVGCPGAFEGTSLGSKKLNEGGGLAIIKFQSQGKTHLDFGDVLREVIGLPVFSKSNEKISLNVFTQYYNFSSSHEDLQPGKNVNVNEFAIIQGSFTNDSDLMVQIFDESAIYDTVKANKKQYFSITATHRGLDDTDRTKILIRKFVNNETLSWLEKTLYLKSSS